MRELASETMRMEPLDSELYQDATSGRWLQRGGPRIGNPDEIDTSVPGESSRETALRRQAVTETLVPLDLLIQMPPPELGVSNSSSTSSPHASHFASPQERAA